MIKHIKRQGAGYRKSQGEGKQLVMVKKGTQLGGF